MSGLVWRPIAYKPGTDLVNGTELAMAFVPGTLSRFAIYETRSLDTDRMPCLVYRLRDAATVGDEGIRSGMRPAIVGTFADPDQAAAAALASM